MGQGMPDEPGEGLVVRDFVAPAGVTLGLDSTLGEACRLLEEEGRALPVLDEGRLVGILTREDLDALPPDTSPGMALREMLRLRVVYCFADSDVAQAAATMRAAAVSHLAVLGEDVRFLGLLDQRDLPAA